MATRNILVTENYVIKIADFGLARDVGADSQYVKTSTVSNSCVYGIYCLKCLVEMLSVSEPLRHDINCRIA